MGVIMETTAVNSTVPTDRQNLAVENREPRQTEKTETSSQENREAYRVDLSKEAQAVQETSGNGNTASGPENSEAVKAYTSAGRIAG
jgi:hypothetical protein